jgi:pimeloyl-ACP methyl ester carboxylesterase
MRAIRECGIHVRHQRVILVGHDLGAAVAHAFARQFPDAVIKLAVMDDPIPGLTDWDEVKGKWPRWHFAFHNIPGLPEALMSGRELNYLSWFYHNAYQRNAITDEMRGSTPPLTRNRRRSTQASSITAHSIRMLRTTLRTTDRFRCRCSPLAVTTRLGNHTCTNSYTDAQHRSREQSFRTAATSFPRSNPNGLPSGCGNSLTERLMANRLGT